jgi:hypothetical protein
VGAILTCIVDNAIAFQDKMSIDGVLKVSRPLHEITFIVESHLLPIFG